MIELDVDEKELLTYILKNIGKEICICDIVSSYSRIKSDDTIATYSEDELKQIVMSLVKQQILQSVETRTNPTTNSWKYEHISFNENCLLIL